MLLALVFEVGWDYEVRVNCQEAIGAVQAAGGQGRSMRVMGAGGCAVGKEELCVSRDKSV